MVCRTLHGRKEGEGCIALSTTILFSFFRNLLLLGPLAVGFILFFGHPFRYVYASYWKCPICSYGPGFIGMNLFDCPSAGWRINWISFNFFSFFYIFFLSILFEYVCALCSVCYEREWKMSNWYRTQDDVISNDNNTGGSLHGTNDGIYVNYIFRFHGRCASWLTWENNVIGLEEGCERKLLCRYSLPCIIC